MEIMNLVQGSDEWKKARMEHFTASEAPAMKGASKYMTRNKLLALKKGAAPDPIGPRQQALYDRGHETEVSQRTIMEIEKLVDMPPLVGRLMVDGLALMASFDGLPELFVWEHKLWNETLGENTRNKVIDPMHYWQLEHQMLVAGVDKAEFTVSDGTTAKRETMFYLSVPERRQELIDGWKQFAKDLEAYEIEVKQELVEAKEAESLPVPKYEANGTSLTTNLPELLQIAKDRAQVEMSRKLETDQDFADKDAFNKVVKEGRASLKIMVEQMQGEYADLAAAYKTAQELDGVWQKMQSHGETQVKKAKEAKKNKIRQGAIDALNAYIEECNAKIDPVKVHELVDTHANFDGVMKNKRTIESLQSAVDDELADVKIRIIRAVDKAATNMVILRELAEDYKFLFNDFKNLINQDAEPFTAIVKTRIADHKEAEEKRLAAERETMRLEEEAKAKQKVADDLAEEKRVADAKQVEDDRIVEEARQLEVDQQAAESQSEDQGAEQTESAQEELAADHEQGGSKLAFSGSSKESPMIPGVHCDMASDPDETVKFKVTQKDLLLAAVTTWGKLYGIRMPAMDDLSAIIDKFVD